MLFNTFQLCETGIVTAAPLRLYTGTLGQIGDIVMFTPTVRRLKELFPSSTITFAVPVPETFGPLRLRGAILPLPAREKTKIAKRNDPT